jgi:hypothetical protein
MTCSVGVQVGSAAVAVEVGKFYLDTTRSFTSLSYRIDSVSDIDWGPPELGTDEAEKRADVEDEFGAAVSPVAKPSDTGWAVTLWMVDDQSLVRHHLSISADGAVEDRSEVVVTGLPLPIGI